MKRIVDYWQSRGLGYRPAPLLAGEVDNLIAWVRYANPSSILDMGCGWGRVYAVLAEAAISVTTFSMCDIVQSMLWGCATHTGIMPDLWDGRDLPYNDNSHDLVVGFSTIQHVLPDDLEQVLHECSRVSRGHVLLTAWVKASKTGSYTFLHDYDKAFASVRLDVVKVRQFDVKGGAKRHWLLRPQ